MSTDPVPSGLIAMLRDTPVPEHDLDGAWTRLQAELVRGQRPAVERRRLTAAFAGVAAVAALAGAVVLAHGPSRGVAPGVDGSSPSAGPSGLDNAGTKPALELPLPGDGVASDVVAVDGAVWVADWSGGELHRVTPDSGASVAVPVGRPDGSYSTLAASGVTYVLRGDNGRLERYAAGATQPTASVSIRGSSVAATASGVWVTSCCADGHPLAQTVYRFDPVTLQARGSVSVPEEGEHALLAAGGAGTWLLSEDGLQLNRVDQGRADEQVALAKPATAIAVNDAAVVVVGGSGTLMVVPKGADAVTTYVIHDFCDVDRACSGTGVAVAGRGRDVAVALPNAVIVIDVTTHEVVGRIDAAGITALSWTSAGLWGVGPGVLYELLAG